MSLLEVDCLRVTFPARGAAVQAVRDVSFSVEEGETLCIVGESGCGKSMTSLAIMGLLPSRAVRAAGRLSFAGHDLLSLSEARMSDLRGQGMSMIFQEPMTCLNPCMTIGDQLVEVYRRHRRASRAEAVERAVFLLDKAGIPQSARRLRQYPHQLSGGLRQRVMIAMALMCGPRLIIADEPTTALDVTIQAQMLRLLQDLQAEFGMAILLITHDLGIVARIADRVLVMYAGEVVEQGTAEAVFDRPGHPYTRGLLDCIPVPGRTRPGAHLGAIPGQVPSLTGAFEGCAFRNRCPHAQPICSMPVPMAKDPGAAHEYRCVLPLGVTAAELAPA